MEQFQRGILAGDLLSWYALADFREEQGLSAFRPHDAGVDQYGPWVSFRVGTVEQRMRWIPPGRFWMGSPEGVGGAYEHEGPQHLVEITHGFWMADTPCTWELWEAVMGVEPPSSRRRAFRAPNHDANYPVTSVGWITCQTFLKKCNEQVPGLMPSLPTEAQWEYACCAGRESVQYPSDPVELHEYLLMGRAPAYPGKDKPPNSWGLYHMLGFVFEWCQDGLRSYAKEKVVDPTGPVDEGTPGVTKGGFSEFQGCYEVVFPWQRNPLPRDGCMSNLGFRFSFCG
jgi:formylglycine-generating enzyme required for sulfatase activity